MSNTLTSLALGSSYIAVGLGAIGSAIGTGTAGAAAIGAWKKCYMQGKAAPFLLLALSVADACCDIFNFL